MNNVFAGIESLLIEALNGQTIKFEGDKIEINKSISTQISSHLHEYMTDNGLIVNQDQAEQLAKGILEKKMMSEFFEHDHSLEDLEDMRYEIIYLPLNHQALYVDKIIVNNIDNYDFIDKQLSIEVDDNTFSIFNATSVGNLAYLILNCKDQEHVKKCEIILNKYKEYVEKKYLLI